MRFKDPSKAGKRGAESRFESHKLDPADVCRRPFEGTPLRTITIEDHLTGCSKRIVVKQARRKNQVYVDTFGTAGNPVGWDKIVRRLRKWLVIRWIEV